MSGVCVETMDDWAICASESRAADEGCCGGHCEGRCEHLPYMFAPYRFEDSPDNPGYAGVGRDGVELHLQWHDESEWERVERPSIRFRVENVEGLFEEYQSAGVFHPNTAIRDTQWGTREFAFFDPNMNDLTFYRDR